MKEFENAKKEYDNITIPDELAQRVAVEIDHAKKKRVSKTKYASFRKWAVTVAAVLAVVFFICLNMNPVFAKAMENVPFIGELAKVLTFRQYEVETEDYIITVEIPTIDMISADFADLEESVNKEIYALCEQYANESKENALEYREAFLATGGTLEEWKEHDIRIKISYIVQFQTEEYLSLIVKRTESWNSASAESKTFNIDLQTGKQISVEEVMDATNTTYYEDNFSVGAEAASSHAEKIKEVVANKDLEKLADLTAYPVYIGLDDGIVIENREEFIALGAKRIFTENLIDSITNADVSNLTPSKAGFVICNSDTSVNIIFSVVDGQLKISGINY